MSSVTPSPDAPTVGAGVAGLLPGADAATAHLSTAGERASAIGSYMRRNPSLPVGLSMLLVLAIFLVVGRFFVDLDEARAVSVAPLRPPSAELPFGSDRQGRNMFAVAVAGTPLTLQIGLTAGLLGIGFGATLAFVAAYYGGKVD